jgi:hypothetical protein
MTVTQLIAELTELGPEYKDFPVMCEWEDTLDYESEPLSLAVRGVAVTAKEVVLGS